ncbi:MAG TPA: TIGR04255 family protein [Phycisphaerales bacterium]|nr:TIGR04255 family protein [Phycisphaerales bacterium]
MEIHAKLKRPPVVETAVSVLFAPIAGLTNAHLGAFWNSLREDFPTANDAEPIEPIIERFGKDIARRLRLPQIRFVPAQGASRIQMTATDGHRMTQIQNGRLVYNWRRQADGVYPSWEAVFSHFKDSLERFNKFLSDSSLPTIEPTQWEVVYVNHLFRGDDWNSPAEWPELVPGLLAPAISVANCQLESTVTNSHFVFPKDRGRLHVDLYHGFTGLDEQAKELLIFQLTARGPVDDCQTLFDGLSSGHEIIVRTFEEVIGPRARKLWGS